MNALLPPNVNALPHMPSDTDDELTAILKARPNVFFTLALGGPRRVTYAPWLNPVHPLVADTVSPEQIKRLRDRLAATKPEDLAKSREEWSKLARGIARFAAAGVRVGVGTD